MLQSTILSILVGVIFITQTLAKGVVAPIAGYKMVDIEWNVQATADGLNNLTITGTVQDIAAKLLEVNPNWMRDTDFHKRSNTPTDLEKRDASDWVGLDCNPGNGRWGWAYCPDIREGIKYLRGFKDHKPALGPGPGECGRVSCSWNMAIYWCNDNDHPIELADHGIIAEGAEILIDTCHNFWDCGGQGWNKNNWNVIVREDLEDQC